MLFNRSYIRVQKIMIFFFFQENDEDSDDSDEDDPLRREPLIQSRL